MLKIKRTEPEWQNVHSNERSKNTEVDHHKLGQLTEIKTKNFHSCHCYWKHVTTVDMVCFLFVIFLRMQENADRTQTQTSKCYNGTCSETSNIEFQWTALLWWHWWTVLAVGLCTLLCRVDICLFYPNVFMSIRCRQTHQDLNIQFSFVFCSCSFRSIKERKKQK